MLITPEQLKAKIPLSEAAQATVVESRQVIRDILDGKDHACSSSSALLDPRYRGCQGLRRAPQAARCRSQRHPLSGHARYFEKPRTTVGWKGLINDPYLDDSFKIEDGLHIGRQLLCDLSEMGLPTATEALDRFAAVPAGPDLLVGHRCPHHRIADSPRNVVRLSSAVGFKNGTDGSLSVAINALQSVSSPHRFLGINQQGQVSIVTTKGNPYGHVVLRGGNGKPNYDSVSVALCEKDLEKAGIASNIMVDCSHANSNKDPGLQPLVMDNVANQILEGNDSIIGLMVESHIGWGKPVYSQGPVAAAVRRFGDRCLYRLGNHRTERAQHA
ncbi:3-deoxy-7-phosphoheptulonate synthase [Halopseudomonas pachastrellae]|nr:3-deoxy-7-phosphoheptulonate synthase [Halopseudomonas pachastrellae]